MDDRNAPATKGDVEDAVEAVKDELETKIEAAKDELETKIQGAKDELVEAIRDSETKLLNAFYGFAQTNNRRQAELEVDEIAIRSRLSALESRVLEVEKRLNIPPAA